ncbi:guanosine-3',5'-bis(diphosphate) 3'-pyrophosphohydrolase-like [Globicephala melas]|uniref:guanosine-3',5'-bis(diphosphate) 3'-pyrophosphohydrolase-like n=1 Tax=Globicephala melas TaxID=9731 RepID=UPI00293D9337|nr:guanosine-3',5'-bis(diphosphate) 3'-pyrophosphohydrolase-like [Globicephala melas]
MKTVDFTQEELASIHKAYEELEQVYISSPHSKKVERIRSAFEFALKAHGKVRRKSGEPYIHHPIAVARIVCEEMGLGSTSICSALLHDVVEDTDYTVEDIAKLFDDKIAEIVDGLTKIKGEKLIGYEKSLQAENFRKLIFTMNDDPRVVLIKIADRLHNMRTLGSMRADKQKKIAGETLEFFAPLAHRLGLYAIKSELEKLSFRYDQPERYQELSDRLVKYKDGVDEFFESFIAPIKKRLDRAKIKYEIKYRIKNVYSIAQKMRRKGLTFEEMSDIFAIRIIFDTDHIEDEIPVCRQIQSYIEQAYATRPDRIRDWLAIPKPNGYQALHVTVMLPDAQQVEVQIRSRRMHDIAELGVAAHWRYKERVEGTENLILDQLLAQIRDILEFPDTSAMELLNNFKSSLYANDIFVFTPRGDMYRLPMGATVLDFAYAIHSKLGDECLGANIDHKPKAINHILERGDRIEILSIEDEVQCKPHWLDIVVTPKAKVAIRSTLRREQKKLRSSGQEELEAIFKEFDLNPTQGLIDNLLNFYALKSQDELYVSIALNEIKLKQDISKIETAVAQQGRTFDIKEIVNYIVGSKKTEKVTPQESLQPLIDQKETFILQAQDKGKSYVLASCCKPIVGDEIVGRIKADNQVCVHRSSCPRAMELKSVQGDKIVATAWADTMNKALPSSIFISGVDAKGLLVAICSTISDRFSIDIRDVNVTASKGIFEAYFELSIQNVSQLEKLCSALKELDNVISAKRIEL